VDKRDTVFYAAGAFIKSVDAKGKALIGFDWNSTQAVRNIVVDNTMLWVNGVDI
jgi:hypothetical protein